MHDTLSPSAHGLLDYVTVVIFALAPTLFQFDGLPALVAYGLAAVHLVLTLATHFPMGMFDGISLRAHGVAELVVSVALIILPWVAGFIQPGAQWFFPVMGVFVFGVWLLSDYGPLVPAGGPAQRTDTVAPADPDSIPGGRHPETAVAGDEERSSFPPERDVETPRPSRSGEGGKREKSRRRKDRGPEKDPGPEKTE